MLSVVPRAPLPESPEQIVSSDQWPSEFIQSANLPGYAGDGNYFIVLTAASRGSIPAQIWRRAYVIHL